MSVNLDLSFEIRDYDAEKRSALLEATSQFLEDEGLLQPFGMVVDCVGPEATVCGYTTFPAIISRSYLWVPDVTARWQAMAAKVNGGPCKAVVEVNYPDGD